MQGQVNPKIVGATIIGFALIGGAYTINNITKPNPVYQYATVQSGQAPERVFIEVTDSDDDGVEDWQDAFVTTDPIIVNPDTEPYEPPDTLTGEFGINFMSGVLGSRMHGPFGPDDDELIQRGIEDLRQQTTQKLYSTSDISIIENWDVEDVVNYANTVAAMIYRHNQPGLEAEIDIAYEIMNTGDTSRLEDLETLANVYKNYRDDSLKIPVPDFMAKEHLDLINTFEAVYSDTEAMTMVYDDPAVSLMRLKRYQDDVTGMYYAFQNINFSLEPFADQFTEEDPAVFFIYFNPHLQFN